MSEPLVVCICPTRNRPEFLVRAIECFRSQTWPNRNLEILENYGKRTIGHYRNQVIRQAGPCDFIAHWDDDDWSAPNRLAEQVAFLQATGAEVVGYQDMPFYDQDRGTVHWYTTRDPKYAMGTSLLYKRSLWERRPFPDQRDEDCAWLREMPSGYLKRQSSVVDGIPRMFATIHKGNTTKKPRWRLADQAVAEEVRKHCQFGFASPQHVHPSK